MPQTVGLFGVLCGLFSLAPAQAADANQEFWLSRTVALPQTHLFRGTFGNTPVWLRLAPQSGKSNQFLGEYGTYSLKPAVVEESFLDGTANGRSLILRESAFDWEKNKVTSRTKFTLKGWGTSSPMTLTGAGIEKGAPRIIELQEVPFKFPAGSQIRIKSLDKSFRKLRYNIALRYPVLSSSRALSPSVRKFNTQIEGLIQAADSDFQEKMKEFDADLPPTIRPSRPYAYTAGAFSLSWAANDLASGDFVQDVFYGGAHGVMLHEPLTYDFKRGRKLALSELFTPNSNYLSVLAKYCRPAIREWLQRNDSSADSEMLNKGTTPTAENYDVWALTPNGLSITFVDYQVGPYAQGESTVLIPYSSLKGLLKPEFASRLKI